MAKKTITKEHPITTFRKANEARDVVVIASMKKMQTGGKTTGTPFQGYMKTPGAVASDTVAKRDDINTLKKAPNKPGLDKAFRKTYGDDYVGRQSPGIYSKSAKEADLYDRKMGPMKKGGTVKSKKK